MPSTTARLTREQWLRKALDALSRGGGSRIRVERLAADLGVTTGSFYWHFKSLDEFLRLLLDHWKQVSTASVIEHVDATPGDARERLLELMRFVIREDLGRYDTAVGAWASQDPEVAAYAADAIQARVGYVTGLFSEMGYEPDEAVLRTSTLVGYMNLVFSPFAPRDAPLEARLDTIDRLHEWLTRP